MNQISIDPAIRSGEPSLKGTRLTVSDVISIYQGGESSDYNLTQEQVDACLRFQNARANENGRIATRKDAEIFQGSGAF